jgi:hypothetical protein
MSIAHPARFFVCDFWPVIICVEMGARVRADKSPVKR